MSKHTPGPWHWEGIEVKDDPYDRIRYQVTTVGKSIARIVYSSFEGGPTNAEYDARLIAAAPELLAALEELESHCYAGALEIAETHPAISKARAAIAKATA